MQAKFNDLFYYKRQSLYNIAKNHDTIRSDEVYDYEDSLLNNVLSNHLFQKENLNVFLSFMNDSWVNLINATKKISLFKSYTVDINYKNVN